MSGHQTGSPADDCEFLHACRLVELKRENSVVYARSLRRGEEDTGEGVRVGAGERLVIPRGHPQPGS